MNLNCNCKCIYCVVSFCLLDKSSYDEGMHLRGEFNNLLMLKVVASVLCKAG